MISAELLDKLFSQICQMHMLDICAHLYIDAASYLHYQRPVLCSYSNFYEVLPLYMDGIKCDAIYQNTAPTCTGWALIKHRKGGLRQALDMDKHC